MSIVRALEIAFYGNAPVECDPYERAALGFNVVAPDEIDEDPPPGEQGPSEG